MNISEPISERPASQMWQDSQHAVQGPGSVTATLLAMAIVFVALIWLAAPWRAPKVPRAKARLRRDDARARDEQAVDDHDDDDDDDDDDEHRDDDPPGAHFN